MVPTAAQLLGRSRSPSPDPLGTARTFESKTSATTSNSITSEQAKAEIDKKPFRHPEGTYEGESNENLVPQGFGSYFYKNGDVFKGMWENGIREGQGTMTYATGESYCGEYHLSLAHGEGRYEFTNGDVYEGSFQAGEMHGPGVYRYHTGER